MPKFRKKPVEVQAWRWDAEQSRYEWPTWMWRIFKDERLSLFNKQAHIVSEFGPVVCADPGDWIVMDERGELVVLPDEAFRSLYERAE